MGKHKDKYREGSTSVFASYLANLPPEGTNDGIGNGEVPLPDNMKASTLLEQIGKERSWFEDQINEDLQILEINRIYTVKDLRVLSRDSWKQIQFLPLVKDLIREAIARGLPDPGSISTNESENKEKNCSASCSSSSSSDDSDGESEDLLETKASPSLLSVNNALQLSSTAVSSSSTSTTVKKFVGHNRLRIVASNGRAYEVDRYCPHKKADLASRGVVLGNKLICTKHNWEFSLDQGGRCVRHGSTINACAVNDW
ncbi:2097_t:CDS:2 [Ambispora leptoticha]|uniref:2097_t:CDS:1 n=1 Tax=Ambispora leptoticha TaxID=144679 RepID=A0A9N8VHJ8_9GLOM|nr:2097_t:CDS:2 [Ambispora leptoticha]